MYQQFVMIYSLYFILLDYLAANNSCPKRKYFSAREYFKVM